LQPNLRNKVQLPGVGHWTAREAPTEVNRLMVEFLAASTTKVQRTEDCSWKHHRASRRCNSPLRSASVYTFSRNGHAALIPSDSSQKCHGRLDAIWIGLLEVSAVALLASASSGNIIGAPSNSLFRAQAELRLPL